MLDSDRELTNRIVDIVGHSESGVDRYELQILLDAAGLRPTGAELTRVLNTMQAHRVLHKGLTTLSAENHRLFLTQDPPSSNTDATELQA